MGKELPYYQFEPGQYLTGNIQLCSIPAQGLFANICAFYWQRECKLTLEQLKRKFDFPDLIQELIKEKIIKVKKDAIRVTFLDKQYAVLTTRKSMLSLAGLKGALKKREASHEAPLKQLEEKRRDKKKKEKKIIEDIKERKLKFADTLKPFLDVYGKEMLNAFYGYWTEPNLTNTKFRQEMQKTWDLELRLTKWSTNDKNFKKSKNDTSEKFTPQPGGPGAF